MSFFSTRRSFLRKRRQLSMTSDIYIYTHFPATPFCNLWSHQQEPAMQSTTGCHMLKMTTTAWVALPVWKWDLWCWCSTAHTKDSPATSSATRACFTTLKHSWQLVSFRMLILHGLIMLGCFIPVTNRCGIKGGLANLWLDYTVTMWPTSLWLWSDATGQN